MLKKTILYCCLAILTIGVSYGQSSLQILDAQLVLESDNLTGLSTLTVDELEDLDQTVLDSIFANRDFFVTAAIHVSDTGNIETIHVRIGRTVGGTDLANVSVPYNGSLPSGVIGLLKGSEEIEVEFGKHSNTTPLYLEVWIDDKQGHTTSVFQASTL